MSIACGVQHRHEEGDNGERPARQRFSAAFDPDIPVDDTPGDWMQGRDVQLQAAIACILGEMQEHPASLPPTAAGAARVSEGGRLSLKV